MLIGRKTTPAVAVAFPTHLLPSARVMHACVALFLLLIVSVNRLHADPAPKTMVFFGDSLTAGYGLESPATDAYPALIQEKLNALAPSTGVAMTASSWHVVNAGLSGETTAGGLRRIDWVLRQPVDLFILALGGNDGLRGIDPTLSEKNLQAIIDHVRTRYPAAKIVLTGMMMPGFMGEDYVKAFAAMYPALAEKNRLALVPFLLDGVGGHPNLNQADGIHPTPAGHKIIAETVWSILKPLL
jgi:acyl-CoA thioesterase I